MLSYPWPARLTPPRLRRPLFWSCHVRVFEYVTVFYLFIYLFYFTVYFFIFYFLFYFCIIVYFCQFLFFTRPLHASSSRL